MRQVQKRIENQAILNPLFNVDPWGPEGFDYQQCALRCSGGSLVP